MDPMHDQNAASFEALGAPQGASSDPREERSSLDLFLARAALRRAEQEAHPERFTGPWVDPDPAAIKELPESRHPITVFLDESKQTRGHIANRKYSIRHVLAELTHQPRESVTWDDVVSYPWHHVTPDMAREFRLGIYRKYANRHSRHTYIQTLRSILGRCRQANLISMEALVQVWEQLPTRGSRGRARHARCLTPAEVSAVLSATTDSEPFLAARDSAIFALMATTGMRVSEVVGLDLADWDRREATLILRETKNGQDRVVPVDSRVKAYLDAWLTHRGGFPGPLFTPIPGRARAGVHMTTKAVQERLGILAQRAQIGLVHTHDFRRTVATTLLRTQDASIVAGLLGHLSLSATLTYDLSGQQEHRHAISTLPLPECAIGLETEGAQEDDKG